jgi:ABC-2 type transport system ATP-binding protein
VDAVMEQCSLTDVGKRIIGQLSKGYKQRVGLADALVHEPELIILDEPTIGLDPHQIRAVRALIKSLAESHTVLISTHILPEAEMMCNQVLIMYQGRIVASDTPENLHKLIMSSGRTVAELAAPEAELRECLSQMPEVERFEITPADGEFFRCLLTSQQGIDLRLHVFALARERGWYLRELTLLRPSLEDIYVRVTRPDEEEEG